MVSSLMFTFTSMESTLYANYFPPIVLDPNSEYVMGLVYLETYNSIPNIDVHNNKFYYGADITTKEKFEIPPGSYEIQDLSEITTTHLYETFKEKTEEAHSKDAIQLFVLSLFANLNTLKCSLKSNFYIDFTPEDSIGVVLGFKPHKLHPKKRYISEGSIHIMKSSS